MTFAHLHNHSHYSLLDGLSRPAGMIQRAAELEQPAIALTDHGGLSGLFQLWKASQGTGVKPIAGCEFYIAPQSRHDKEAIYFGSPDQRASDISGTGAYGHITILSRNSEGVRNLCRLQARAYSEGFYRKPRIDLDLLSQYSDGLICLTGCPGGLLSTRVRLGQMEEAKKHLEELKDIFGDDLFIEVMSHGIGFEGTLNAGLLTLASFAGVPPVATGDSHYTLQPQAHTHQALLCVQTRSKLENPTFSFDGGGYHLMSREEMEWAFNRASLPSELLDKTLKIAERVENYDSVFEHQLMMPKFDYDTTRYHSSEAALKDMALGGATSSFGDTYDKRRRYELDTICSLGFADYFLVVADILGEAKSQGIRIGPARGSAGGSLVAYDLGIQGVDPIPSGLLFERFLNPERVGLPDIDIDVQEDRRDEVLAIAREKYGEGCVASLGTFGTVGAKASLKDSARVLGYSYKVGEEATYQLPPARQGFQPTLDQFEGDKNSDVYQLAVGLEGTVRSESVHAAAIIISPKPLQDLIPLRLQGGKGDWVTAYDMHEIEDLGFVKTDILGLRTLKVIDDCLQMLRHTTEVHLPTAPGECTDPATYALLARGESTGVFQLDGRGMQGLLRQVAPTAFNDISAVLALYRPGPMGVKADRDYAQRKHGKQRISFPHPELQEALEPILSETYGLIVYQEQVLEVLAAVGDYTYGSAELIFNAMRKKLPEKMAEAKPDFISRMKAKGYSEPAIEALWDVLIPFSAYSFNKSHSTGYGIIAYWAAYLKANYPKEWMAALLSNEPDPKKLAEYLDECNRMGIPILPPDINESGTTFTPTADGIRYGLAAIKGVGEKALNSIIGRRPYRNIANYLSDVPTAGLNVGVVSALVRAGAFDSIISHREGFISVLESHIEKAGSERKAKKKGQRGVVAPQYRVPKEPIDLKQRRRWEKETLGVELSHGTLYLSPTSPMSESDLIWVREELEKWPGSQPVMLEIGSAVVETGCKVNPRQAQQALKPLGKLRMEER